MWLMWILQHSSLQWENNEKQAVLHADKTEGCTEAKCFIV